MAGGPYPANLGVKKNKFVKEWNGRREITEKSFRAYDKTAVEVEGMEDRSRRSFCKRADVYQILSRSIAPAISGEYTHDIKKAITCRDLT
jgi:DNA replicative helicase MCM subunit Mcm2 (Cdc46/Mcm family)